MPVNVLNLAGLDVVDFRETATEYHVRAKPKVVARQCLSKDDFSAKTVALSAVGDLPFTDKFAGSIKLGVASTTGSYKCIVLNALCLAS